MTSEFVVAVHAVVFLNHKATSMNSEEIAENVCTNPARIRKIMAKLKKAGLVATKEGPVHGGYQFIGDPKKTHLLTIFSAVEEKVIQPSWQSGNPEMACLIASGMAGIMGGVFEEMDERCKEYLKTVTVADIDQKIFIKE